MVEKVLRYLNRLRPEEIEDKHGVLKAIKPGTYTIDGGSLELPFVMPGQYIAIFGSALNDGVYKYPAEGLEDETFTGAVWVLSIPRGLMDVINQMSEWEEKYGAASSKPFTSESFGGYTYSRATDSATGGAPTVFSTFKSQLKPWRKI